jgi:hypothetical protein
LGYCIYGAISGLFGSPERRDKWTTAILFGVDIREKFVDMVNISIETIEKVSEEWDICIY